MNKLVRTHLCIILVALTLFMSACQANPGSKIVNSKNDGSFDASVIISAQEHHNPDETQELVYEEQFTSTDGSIEYYLRIDTTINAGDMPVVQVSPHYISEDDAERVAYTLFENVEYYEAEPMFDPVYSKNEIREKLARWSSYTTQDAITQLYGEERTDTAEIVKRFIEKYTELYETAPEENPHLGCQWEYKKESFYYEAESVASTLDTSNENDNIQATATIDGIHYLYKVSRRDNDDYKLNNISLYLYDGLGPDLIDENIFRAQLCRTDEPTDESIEIAKNKAVNMLNEIGFGDWIVDQCYVETKYYGEVAEYIINVTAVPVFGGVPVIRQDQITNLKSEENYASNYYLTDASFQFSANGDIVSFILTSPVDVVDTINSNVAVMPTDKLVDIAKTNLVLRDYYEYDEFGLVEISNEELTCKVTISDIEYGLARVKVPNTDESYYYIPALAIYGVVEYMDKNSGDIYYTSEEPILLITLNAIDGTIVNTING